MVFSDEEKILIKFVFEGYTARRFFLRKAGQSVVLISS